MNRHPMKMSALACCRCGGPLANPESLPALIDCLYCGTVNAATHQATYESGDPAAQLLRRSAIARFTEALVGALNEGRPPLDALRACSAAHLGVAGRADTVARITLALAQDFEQEAQVAVVRDAVLLTRIAEAYLLALDGLRVSELHVIHLPFLTANTNGPVHFQRAVSAKLLAELAAREPVPAKKRGWWPFT